MFSVAFVCPWWGRVVGSHETTTQDAVGESQVTWDPPDLCKLVRFTRMYSVGCIPAAAVASLGIVCPGGGVCAWGCLPHMVGVISYYFFSTFLITLIETAVL